MKTCTACDQLSPPDAVRCVACNRCVACGLDVICRCRNVVVKCQCMRGE